MVVFLAGHRVHILFVLSLSTYLCVICVCMQFRLIMIDYILQGLETTDTSHFITPQNIERLEQAREANRVQVCLW